MSNNNVLKGYLVAFATSYGMLATFVKWPIMKDTPAVTTSQFVLGIIGILLINLFQKKKTKQRYKRQSKIYFN
jgi:hypothetical protein